MIQWVETNIIGSRFLLTFIYFLSKYYVVIHMQIIGYYLTSGDAISSNNFVSPTV
jgi:hypothetical protein